MQGAYNVIYLFYLYLYKLINNAYVIFMYNEVYLCILSLVTRSHSNMRHH